MTWLVVHRYRHGRRLGSRYYGPDAIYAWWRDLETSGGQPS